LSTLLNIESPDRPKLRDGSSITFSELVELLNSRANPPSIAQINSWLSNVEIFDADLGPFIGFKEGNYWRHRVCRNEAVEMLVICWRPGQQTPIHDHNGSHGVVRVYKGLMYETIFAFDAEKGLCYKTGRECPVGTLTGADVPDIHQLGNPEHSGKDLITIHVYSPPLGVLKTYKLGSSQVDLYTPNDFPA
jgi:cysteine dioxygenase